MRIAQVAPLFESVPPRLYGGTERIVSYLTEELVHQGNDVTLFASGDSRTRARLVSVWDKAVRLDDRHPDATALHVLMVEEVFKHLPDFDIVHFHIDGLHLPLARRYAGACVSTMHGRLDLAGLASLYGEFADLPLVSISDAQRWPLQEANWAATVHHGLPRDLYTAGMGAGGYLAFLGRVSPEKGLDRAIEIARRSTMPLKIAAKVDRADRDFFAARIRPLIDGHFIEYLGELGDEDKGALLRDAAALLFPIDWPEPFGISMIESMACGTPVIAFERGSVPEIVEEGVNGYIVRSVGEAVQRVAMLDRLKRARCREVFERRFSAERMARDYFAVYRNLTGTVAGLAAGFADAVVPPISGCAAVQ